MAGSGDISYILDIVGIYHKKRHSLWYVKYREMWNKAMARVGIFLNSELSLVKGIKKENLQLACYTVRRHLQYCIVGSYQPIKNCPVWLP